MNAAVSSRRLSAAALVVLVALVLLGPLARPAQAATPLGSADAGFLSLINNLRSTLGLSPFALDPELSGIARSWSAHMADTGTLAHNGALTSQVTQGWSKLGENVGRGVATEQIFNALVASPGHLRNMSDPAFSRIGIGTVSDARGGIWTTHVFLQPRPARATPAPAPPAPPATTAQPAKPAAAATTPTSAAPRTAATTASTGRMRATTLTTAAPATTPAPTTTPPATTSATVPGETTDLDVTEPRPRLAADLVAASPRQQPVASGLVVGAAVLTLLVLGAGGLAVRRRQRGSG